jgi:hypothetical protein
MNEQLGTVIIGGGHAGINWLYKQKSHFMANAGPAEDAAYLAQQITARS